MITNLLIFILSVVLIIIFVNMGSHLKRIKDIAEYFFIRIRNMVTIKVKVFNFRNHPIYFFYLSKRLFETFSKEVTGKKCLEETSKEDFKEMILSYFDTLKN